MRAQATQEYWDTHSCTRRTSTGLAPPPSDSPAPMLAPQIAHPLVRLFSLAGLPIGPAYTTSSRSAPVLSTSACARLRLQACCAPLDMRLCTWASGTSHVATSAPPRSTLALSTRTALTSLRRRRGAAVPLQPDPRPGRRLGLRADAPSPHFSFLPFLFFLLASFPLSGGVPTRCVLVAASACLHRLAPHGPPSVFRLPCSVGTA